MKSHPVQLQRTESGFTLIELSLVLVIIGLVIGGILVGQDLIKAAQLRSVIKEVEQFKGAVNTFKIRYNGIPGDITNASALFGAVCPDYDPTRTSGNGDGIITGTGNGSANFVEWALGMCQLSKSKLVRGEWCGEFGLGGFTCGGVTPSDTRGLQSDYSGVARYILNDASACSGQNCFRLYGVNGPDGPVETRYGVLDAREGKAVDDKIDDGLPRTGKVLAFESVIGHVYSWNECIVTDPTSTYFIYNLPNKDHQCVMDFMLGL